MLSPSRPSAVIAIAVAAAFASAPVQADSTVTEVDAAAPATQSMALADNETFQNPFPMADNAMPDYPANMLPHNLPPQAVCVRVTISEEGTVSGTAPIGAGPDCPAESNAAAAFYESAQQAAQSWKFEPAFRCIYPKGTKPDRRGCFGEKVKEVPEAVSLVYRFVFENTGGNGAVRFAD